MNCFLLRVGVALGICLAAATAGAQVPDVARGRGLYENHCQRCHSSSVHKRVNRIPATRAEVRQLVEQWQTQQKLLWGTQEVDDVVEFLARTQYRFD
jgi:mono/diheme cytochrome c family protein